MNQIIKSVKLLYPSLMTPDAVKKIFDLHLQVKIKEEERVQCFMRQQILDKEIAEIKDILTNLKNTYELIYEEEKVKEAAKGQAPTIVESNGTIHI